ncbi:hypothetical protein PVK06_019823 [Gossypium arboreum]|uniref:Uncharacterized protein n=1 Tax=Gossypium arboreum TaxID=29729 RepID=A0ABR0PL49_GOSAR|nr:hypothetical protein PVK06_019823 [Gossypium arboreum]
MLTLSSYGVVDSLQRKRVSLETWVNKEIKKCISEEEVEEEEDDEVPKDDDFTSCDNNFQCAFASTQRPTGGLVNRETSHRPEMSSAWLVVREKGKGIAGSSEVLEDDLY